jgi:Zn-dependent oligopeptidase
VGHCVLEEKAAEDNFQVSVFILNDFNLFTCEFSSLFRMEEDEMRNYFQLEHVLSNMFKLAEKLFQLEIVKDDHASKWNSDAQFYQVRSAEGKLFGGFYFDPYVR